MSFALLTHASAQGDNGATTGSIDTTGADLLVAVTCSFTAVGNNNNLSDNKSNTWHELTTQTGGSGIAAIYYAWNPTVGTGHTFTFQSAGSFAGVSVAAFSGSQTSSDPFDVQNGSNSASASSLTTGSVTPSVDNELLVFGATGNWGGTLSVDVGSIAESQAVSSDFATSLAYQIQTTATARNPNFSWTGGAAAAETLIATFKAASGGTTTPSSLEFIWDPQYPQRRRARLFGAMLQDDAVWPRTAVATPSQYGWDNPPQFAERRRWVVPHQDDPSFLILGTLTPTQQGFAWEPSFPVRRRRQVLQPDEPTDQWPRTAVATPLPLGWEEPAYQVVRRRLHRFLGDDDIIMLWPTAAQTITVRYIGPSWRRRRSLPPQ